MDLSSVRKRCNLSSGPSNWFSNAGPALSRKREASPERALSQTTLAEVPEGSAKKRLQTAHNALAHSPSAQNSYEATGLSRLHDTTGVQTDKQLLHKTMYAAHQPLSELARQSAQIKDSPFEQVGVDFDAYCNAFQHAHIHLEDAVNTWLKPGHTNTQTDCPQANRGPPAMAGTRPLPPSPFSVTGATLAGCQQALTSAQPQYTLAQHPSDLSSMCLNLSPSSHTALSALPGKPKADPDLKQQQQQGGCRSLTEDARLNFRGGLQGQGDRVNWQCPQGQGHPGQAPVFNPTEATAFGRGWVPGQAPTPGCVGTVYQFQGSGGGGAGVQQGSCGGPTGVQQGSGRGPAEGQQGVSNRTQAGCTNTSQVGEVTFKHPNMTYQEMQAAEAARYAPFIQAPTGGVAQGHPPHGQRGPDYPRVPTGSPVPLGWTARYGCHGSGGDEEDDYDSELQAALAASMAEQPQNRAPDLTCLVGVAPGKKDHRLSPSPAPCSASAAQDAAEVEEVARLTAEPLFLRAHNGMGGVWQNEKDSSVPSNESPAAPRADSPSSMPSLPKTTTAQTEPASLPVAPNSQISNSPAADVLLGSSATPDACAEQVAELTLGTCPAGLQLAADHAGVSKGNLSVLEELLGERELRAQLQAYGAQSESCCTSDDGCEDANVGNGSEVSYEAVSDSCSEEQEDYDAAREAVRKGDEGNEARLPRVFTLWRPFT